MGFDDFVYLLKCRIPQHRNKFGLALIGALVSAYYYNRKCWKLKNECPEVARAAEQANDHRRVGVNFQFIQQLRKLLPICVPGKILS